MTRIIAGSARGRRLAVPVGRETRPTADRVREGLFSTLGSLLGVLDGLRFLDLYAGSGAVGLEALSRGAGCAVLVESDPRAVRAITHNIEALGFEAAVVQARAVEHVVRRPPQAPFDIVFADPPYAVTDDDLRAVLADAFASGWLAPSAVVAVERPTRSPSWLWPPFLVAERSRRYGEAMLWYGRAARPSPRGDDGTGRSEE